jgi:hypothetical protein
MHQISVPRDLATLLIICLELSVCMVRLFCRAQMCGEDAMSPLGGQPFAIDLSIVLQCFVYQHCNTTPAV